MWVIGWFGVHPITHHFLWYNPHLNKRRYKFLNVLEYIKIKHGDKPNFCDLEKRLELNRCTVQTTPNEFKFEKPMIDSYFEINRCIERLIDDYKKYGLITIAYDFDDTVCPSDKSISCDAVINLLQICSELQFPMICFTARDTTDQIEEVRTVLKDLHIRCDYINEDCLEMKKLFGGEHVHKIYYSVFLDDRAGLQHAYKVLLGFIKWYLHQEIENVKD